MIPPMILHPMQLVAASISSVEDMMQHPLALPVAVGAVTVFLTILLFYNISESLKKRTDAGGESTVRRSTRSSKGGKKSLDTSIPVEEPVVVETTTGEGRSRSAARTSSRKTVSKSPVGRKTTRSRSASVSKKTAGSTTSKKTTSSGSKKSTSSASTRAKKTTTASNKAATTRRSTSAKRSSSVGAKKEASTVKPKKTASKTGSAKKTSSRSATPSRRATRSSS